MRWTCRRTATRRSPPRRRAEGARVGRVPPPQPSPGKPGDGAESDRAPSLAIRRGRVGVGAYAEQSVELTVEGRSVFAATGGRPPAADAPLVLLLHGAGMDHTTWVLQA